MDERVVISIGQSGTLAELGGKAYALSVLDCQGFSVPPWVVLTPAGYFQSLDEDQQRVPYDTNPEGQMFAGMTLVRPSDAILQDLQAALSSLDLEGKLLAVRSSALEEDGSGHSFAGQYESFLAVPPDRLAERIADVWRSGFSPRVLAYRRERGLGGAATPPAVLVQEYVNAGASGVAFGADPVTGRRGVVVVSAVPGLGTALVGGDADADTFHVDHRSEIIARKIAVKKIRHVADPEAPEGVREQALPEDASTQAAITNEQALAVADLVRQAGDHFGRPQDIEWVIRQDDGELLLLQSRPITSLLRLADPDGGLQLWDNANIAESYSGITTPLTFSFARLAYEGVYRQFCLLLRVPRAVVDDHADTFANMLGLIRGRVYYNLLNWYRMLSLLPGFDTNRKFMEQMMGVREGLPDELLKQFEREDPTKRWQAKLRLLRVGGALVREHLRLRRTISRFYRRLDVALRDPEPPLADQRLDQLAEEFRRLERSLISRWDAPLVNDFLAMIFFGTLRSLSAKWIDRDDAAGGGQLHNHLLTAEGGIISAEPARRIREMADSIRGDETLIAVLCNADPSTAMSAVTQHSELHAHFHAYREKFGDRCLEELKLEAITLMDDPTPLLRSIGYAARRPAQRAEDSGEDAERALREQAERQLRDALRGHPLRRVIYRWVLKHARHRVRDRENLRFERTRLFGRVRRIFLEIGKRLRSEGVLDHPRDVFYLEVEELIGFVGGTATCTDLASLVAVRRGEFEKYRKQPPPADRFETRGAVAIGNEYLGAELQGDVVKGDRDDEQAVLLQGVGACPGIVRGKVRVILDPRGIELNPGTIVVAERTDPGWIMVFPAAAGLLVQHGSLLSHSAIVSRELCVPSIVSIPDVTRRLHDGDVVEMDGQRGTVRVLAHEPEKMDDDGSE